MCVIAVQTKNQPNLTYDEVRAMCKQNPHGFGIMWNDGKKTYYRKGFFEIKEFYNFYITIRQDTKVCDVALHMRIGTGSNIDVANCHPFPISSVPKRIKSAKGTADVCIMMNGIIGSSTKEFSDTALYTMNTLKMYYNSDVRFYKHFTRKQRLLFDNEIHGCRFAFMDRNSCDLFGVGWSDYNGKAMVSNRHWVWNTNSYQSYYRNSDDSYYYDWWTTRNSTRFATKKSDKRHKSYIDYLQETVV